MVTDAQFNALAARVTDVEARLDVVEEALNATVEDSFAERLATVENTMVSIQQVVAMKKIFEDTLADHDTQLADIDAQLTVVLGLMTALRRWRIDLRRELVFEEATDLGGGLTWELSGSWDQDAMFVVFQSALTLVDPSNITPVTDEPTQFAASVALTGPVLVMYFKAL